MAPRGTAVGDVLAATLIPGINSDLGPVIAQISQNIYDSGTGHRLLIAHVPSVLRLYLRIILFLRGAGNGF
ncbi:hypothetical protein CCGE531_33360 (plasmid) [Rhizobium sp. CCGE531]|nr:hypothetical protein CCGE531_33360 [Rhizobium sp. CCGE531]AYG77202.1 hypothetical protein CCGE532_32520 [Rhizobium sp. CCGE532]